MRPPKHIRDKAKAKVVTAVAAFKAERKAGVKAETSRGYRLSPNFEGATHACRMHPGSMFNTSNSDGILTAKQKASKYRHASNSYDWSKTGGAAKNQDNRTMVKVGMTLERYVNITDKETGDRKLVKLKAQARYKEVGTP